MRLYLHFLEKIVWWQLTFRITMALNLYFRLGYILICTWYVKLTCMNENNRGRIGKMRSVDEFE